MKTIKNGIADKLGKRYTVNLDTVTARINSDKDFISSITNPRVSLKGKIY